MNKCAGFNLIELMVTMAAMAILLSVGVPAFKETMDDSRLSSTSNIFVAFLQNARLEAVHHSRTINVCVDNDLSTDACNGTDWATGWKLWVDLDSDGVVDSAEILRVHDGASGNTTIASNGFAAASSIGFTSTGEATSAGSFVVCDSGRTGEAGVQIAISNTGRISSGAPSPACG